MSQYPHVPYQPNEPYSMGPKRANVLGIISLVLGGIGFVAALVPCCGMVVALPLGGIGLVLAVVGLIAASSDGRTSRKLPVIGLAVSLLALIIPWVWTLIIASMPTPPATTQPSWTSPQTTVPTSAPTTSPSDE